jgi:hypothetical protein
MHVGRRPGALSIAGLRFVGANHVRNVIAGPDSDALLLHLERNLMTAQK